MSRWPAVFRPVNLLLALAAWAIVIGLIVWAVTR